VKLEKGLELEADLHQAELQAGSLGLLPAELAAQQSLWASTLGNSSQLHKLQSPIC